MKSNKKILVIRFCAIGDVVMSSIIPSAIKQKHPECEIHFLTNKVIAGMLKNCPHIDKIIPFEGGIIKTVIELFKERYDAILCLNYTLKGYLISFLSFPKKIIFKTFKGISWVENYFNTAKKVFSDLERPERLYLINKNKKTEQKIFDKLKNYKRPYILINPGKLVNQPREGRVWNIEKWKKLSGNLLNIYGGTIFVNGSLAERDYHLALADNNVIVLSGLNNLKETCALISHCDLIISGDSGPVHIASAYNKKTISILGSTSPDKIKPYGKNGYCVEPKTNCRYCWKKKCKFLKKDGYAPCIESIEAEDVLNLIEEKNLLETARIKC